MAKKKENVIVAEYVSSLSDSDLYWLHGRLAEQLCGDLADALDFLSATPEIDRLLSVTESADEVYYYCDMIREALQKEINKKNLVPTK